MRLYTFRLRHGFASMRPNQCACTLSGSDPDLLATLDAAQSMPLHIQAPPPDLLVTLDATQSMRLYTFRLRPLTC